MIISGLSAVTTVGFDILSFGTEWPLISNLFEVGLITDKFSRFFPQEESNSRITACNIRNLNLILCLNEILVINNFVCKYS